METLKNLEEQVIKNTTLEILDEYLYQINIFHSNLMEKRVIYNQQKQDYEQKFELRVQELMETEDEKGKKTSKTASVTIASVEYAEELESLKANKTELENAESFCKMCMVNYHHGKSKLKGEFDIDKQTSDFDNLPKSSKEEEESLPF